MVVFNKGMAKFLRNSQLALTRVHLGHTPEGFSPLGTGVERLQVTQWQSPLQSHSERRGQPGWQAMAKGYRWTVYCIHGPQIMSILVISVGSKVSALLPAWTTILLAPPTLTLLFPPVNYRLAPKVKGNSIYPEQRIAVWGHWISTAKNSVPCCSSKGGLLFGFVF